MTPSPDPGHKQFTLPPGTKGDSWSWRCLLSGFPFLFFSLLFFPSNAAMHRGSKFCKSSFLHLNSRQVADALFPLWLTMREGMKDRAWNQVCLLARPRWVKRQLVIGPQVLNPLNLNQHLVKAWWKFKIQGLATACQYFAMLAQHGCSKLMQQCYRQAGRSLIYWQKELANRNTTGSRNNTNNKACPPFLLDFHICCI